METTKKIAYLAPELPGLSATFVFNEILALEKLGTEICSYSVHRPKNKAHGEKAAQMAKRTAIVYEQSMVSTLKAFAINLFTHKRSSLKALFWLISDVIKTGVISKKSFKLIYQFIRSAWLARDLRKNYIQHLHIHFAHVPSQIGMYAAALAGIPFSFTAHANDIFERPLLIKEKIKRSKKTISISSFNIEIMQQKGGDRNKIEIVRCGVDGALPMRKIKTAVKESPFKIGSLGRLVEKKGMDTLINAGKILLDNNIEFIIEIAGSGPLQEELENQVADNGLGDKVQFLGAMPHSEVTKWMKTLDAFALAAKKDKNGDMDGIPVVLMEAMNAGIPVISTEISGIPELIEHQESGLLCPPENETAFAENIKTLLNDTKLMLQLISRAKHRIHVEFDRELNARKLMRIFNA